MRLPRWLAGLVRRLRGRTRGDPQPDPQPPCILVWDVRLADYRCVELDNELDPLWPAARELATLHRLATAA